MKNLLKKEFILAVHPTSYVFLALSMMLLIPSYPYYVVFFYNGLAVFFTCMSGRESNDVFYSMMLPIAKKDIVKARILMVTLIEVAQIIIAIPFAIVRQSMNIPGNEVGMDANIALFGLSFIMLGLFNFVFFGLYYKDVTKVGTAFILGSIVVFVYMSAAEICTHVVPFFRDVLDTKDPSNLAAKLVILAIGIIIFALLTVLVCGKSVKNFEKLDL